MSVDDSRSEAGYSDFTDATITSETVDELVNPLWIQDPGLGKIKSSFYSENKNDN